MVFKHWILFGNDEKYNTNKNTNTNTNTIYKK